MAKKSIEDFKNELNDKINSIINKRNESILEAERLSKEVQPLVEQLLALDETKVKIVCLPPPLGCNGVGYIEREDGKKVVCPVCGGKYVWATKYIEPTK